MLAEQLKASWCAKVDTYNTQVGVVTLTKLAKVILEMFMPTMKWIKCLQTKMSVHVTVNLNGLEERKLPLMLTLHRVNPRFIKRFVIRLRKLLPFEGFARGFEIATMS
ncbi:MAG: hypothetical protein RUDDFDWM_001014 [Candidatus Fervidibacterota bacterium]